jgi:hypothetical protein
MERYSSRLLQLAEDEPDFTIKFRVCEGDLWSVPSTNENEMLAPVVFQIY